MKDRGGTLEGATLGKNIETMDQNVVCWEVRGAHEGTQDLLVPLIHREIILVEPEELNWSESEGTRYLLLQDLSIVRGFKQIVVTGWLLAEYPWQLLLRRLLLFLMVLFLSLLSSLLLCSRSYSSLSPILLHLKKAVLDGLQLILLKLKVLLPGAVNLCELDHQVRVLVRGEDVIQRLIHPSARRLVVENSSCNVSDLNPRGRGLSLLSIYRGILVKSLRLLNLLDIPVINGLIGVLVQQAVP